MPPIKDLTNQRFGRLVAIQRFKKPEDYARWLCNCDCGNKPLVMARYLTSGKTKSCGCLLKERHATQGDRNRTHGASVRGQVSLTYYSWTGMISRCTKPINKSWSDYGGRGIKVCPQWLADYNQFLADMGERPSKEYTLDRKNTDGDYEPRNCRWATKLEQGRNKRNNKMITYKGKTQCLAAWAQEFNVSSSKMGKQLRSGLSMEQIKAKTEKQRKGQS